MQYTSVWLIQFSSILKCVCALLTNFSSLKQKLPQQMPCSTLAHHLMEMGAKLRNKEYG